MASQYENAIQLLKLIRVDYQRARKELQDVSSHFGDREATASKHLSTALDAMAHANPGYDKRPIISTLHTPPSKPRLQEGGVGQPASEEYAPTLEVYCLGTFQVRVDWKIIDHWRSLKAKSLLGFLTAQQGKPVPRDVLMEALWPGCEPSLANNNLKAAVRALRQTLGAIHDRHESFAWVLFQDGTYMINPGIDLWSDVDQFEYHWHLGRRLEKEGKLAEAMSEHETAAALYRGDYLEDNPYEDWTMLRREALKDIYLAILGRLADYSMNNSDYEGCIIHCQRILKKDRCREDAYQRLMSCYSHLGLRSRAISWYRLCEKTIKTELDMSPDRQTVSLYQKLLNDEQI